MNTNSPVGRQSDVHQPVDTCWPGKRMSVSGTDNILHRDAASTASRRVHSAAGSALDAAQRAFDELVAGQATLALDCDGLDPAWELPSEPVPLRQLPRLVTGACWDARDAIWHRLIAHARTTDHAWVTGAIGVALPMLKAAAARIVPAYHGAPADVDAEILTGFLHALRHLDTDRPRLAGRLTAAAYRA